MSEDTLRKRDLIFGFFVGALERGEWRLSLLWLSDMIDMGRLVR